MLYIYCLITVFMLPGVIHYISVLLLLINGVGALVAGYAFMKEPDGSLLGMSVDWLQYTPFRDYFIPGIILFICNGIFSIITLTAYVLRSRYALLLIMVQGLVLLTWIIVQVYMLRMFQLLHLFFGMTGVFFLVSGYNRYKKRNILG